MKNTNWALLVSVLAAVVLCVGLLNHLGAKRAEVQALSDLVDDTVASWQAIASEKETLQTELGQLESDLREAQLSIEENTTRIDELTTQVEELRTEYATLTDAITAAQEENDALTAEIKNLQPEENDP